MSADDDSDDDAATMIGKTDAVREAIARPGVESPTRKFDVGAISGPTKAMPSGYGIEALERAAGLDRGGLPSIPMARPSQASGFRGARGIPAARPSAPRPAAGRPAVPSVVDDPTSESEMTLIEAIDAELDSITAELSIPEGADPSLLEDAVSASEMTVRMAVPDDLPSSLLDSTSEPGTQIQPPRAPAPPSIHEMPGVPAAPLSLSSMPTPPRHAARTLPIAPADPKPSAEPRSPEDTEPLRDIAGVVHEPTVEGGVAPVAAASVAAASAERPVGPAPAWVARYLVACFLFSVLGAVVLVYLKVQRFW